MIIDSHCHVYPSLKDYLNKKDSFNFSQTDNLSALKNKYRQFVKPYLSTLHKLQEQSRKLPKSFLPTCDKLIALSGAWNTLIDNGVSDLNYQIEENSIDFSFIIAHPPFIPNEFVLELAKRNKKLLPIVNIGPTEINPVKKLEEYINNGAMALKIHAASDGLSENSEHYKKLLTYANTISLPVIIHTGCIHIKPIFKEPEMGHAEHFENWFKTYPNCNFILAHMNYHYPDKAISYCKQFENVYTDTSWQPSHSISKAIKEIGTDKILFGSDWPLIGDNIGHCYKQLLDCVDNGSLTDNELKQIQGLNAIKVFKLESLLKTE